jgi:flagellar L-ring protein precursor FlgH
MIRNYNHKRTTMPRTRWMLLMLLTVGCLAPAASAQSLWPRRNPRFAFMFTDTSARQVGDLLTILVSENTDVQNRDQRALDKSSDAGYSFDLAATSTRAASSASLDISGDSTRTFDGNSQYRVEQEFTDRITVQVTHVLPNGNLVLAGQRSRIVGGEQRQLEISGIVRPIDVSPDNTVRSQFVANFQVRYGGCGAESNFTNQGWGGRLINRLWPF